MLDKIDQWNSANNDEDLISQQKLENWDHPSRTRYWQSIYHHLDLSPPPDTAVVEVSKTLCLIAIEDLLKELSDEGYKFEKLVEVTSYHLDDNLKGILIKFSMKGDSEEKIFEAIVDPKMNVIRKQTAFRQGELLVGTGYDPKELIFRNFLHAMNEDSMPMLMNSFASAQEPDEKDFIMNIVLIDPKGYIALVTEKSVSNNTLIKDAFKLELKEKLIPGIWTIMVVNQKNNQLLTKVPFLVFPTKKVASANLISSSKEHKMFLNIFQKSQTEEDMKYQKLNQDLQNMEWPKLLAREFYSIKEGICQSSMNNQANDADNQIKNLSPKISLCEETLWSSFSPDLKSTITKFDNDLSKLI